jgi:multiple sugar transport system substrate-binding protein
MAGVSDSPVSRRTFLGGGLALAAAAVAGSPLLAACGDGGSAGGAKNVTLTFWDTNAGPDRTPYLQSIIKQFEKANPTIKVKYVGLPIDDVDQKLQGAIASGAVPDVSNGDMNYVGALVAQKGLLALDPYLATWSGAKQILPAAMTNVRQLVPDKKVYGLPFSNNNDVLYYRKDWFTQKGVKPPTTWAEFYSAAAALTDSSKNTYGFGLRGGSGSQAILQSWIFAQSGITSFFDASGKSTFDDPRSVEAIKQAAAMYGKQTSKGDLTQNYQQMVAEFDGGHVAMIFHNLGSYNQHVEALGKDKFGALPLPAGPDGGHVLYGGRYEVIQVFKGSKHPVEAFKFASYVASPTAVSYWNDKIGQIPPNEAVFNAQWVKDNFAIQSALTTLADPKTVVITPPFYLPNYSALQSELEPQYQLVLQGKKTAQDFATTMAANYTKAQQQYKQSAPSS